MKKLAFLLSLVLTVAVAQPARSPVVSPTNGSTGLVAGRSIVPNMSNAVAWYRQGQGVTVTGAGVSQWDSQIGATHLLQGTDTNRPSKEADGSILFDGVDNYLKAVAFTLNQPTTVYLLGKQVTWTDGDTVWDGNALNLMRLYDQTATPNIRMFAGSGPTSNIDFILDTYAVVSAVYNGASSTLQVNNETPTTGNSGTNDAGGFTLGAYDNSGTVGGFSNIQVKEVIIYNVAHDANQRFQDIRYLTRINQI